MTWVIIIGILLALGAVYTIAKQRGERKKAKEVIDREGQLDRKEANDELEEKRNSNAWDNLNDTIDS